MWKGTCEMNHLWKQMIKQMENSKCPMMIKLILREFLRVYRQSGQPAKIELKDIPENFFHYMCLCETKVYVGKCVKENADTVKRICAKINGMINHDNKAAGLTVSDAKTFDGKWTIYPNVISSRRFECIAKTFLNISFETLYTSAFELLTMAYSSICIFITNTLSEKLYKELSQIDGIAVTALTQKDIVQIGIEEDKLEFALGLRPDVFVSCELCMSNTHIYSNGVQLFHLPFHDMFCGDCSRYWGFEFERDICLNVIPQLKRQNVAVMVVRNPNTTVKKIRFRHTSTADICRNGTDKEFQEVQRFLGRNYDDILDAKEKGAICLQNHIAAWTDYQNASIHWTSGERYTEGNRFDEKRTMYFFGPCLISGLLVTDSDTIPSLLKKRNRDLDYTVHNCGGVWEWMGWNLRTKIYKQGDAVIIFAFDSKPYEECGIELVDVSRAYYKLKSDLPKCVWETVYHCNAFVNKNIAELLYEEIAKREWFKVQAGEIGNPFRLIRTGNKMISGGVFGKNLNWMRGFSSIKIDWRREGSGQSV